MLTMFAVKKTFYRTVAKLFVELDGRDITAQLTVTFEGRIVLKQELSPLEEQEVRTPEGAEKWLSREVVSGYGDGTASFIEHLHYLNERRLLSAQ